MTQSGDGARRGLPDGGVTFVMTDVVGSTPMWEADPAAAMDAFARHEAIMSGALDRSGGVRPKDQGEGDSVFAVFASPADAIAFVVDVQRAIAAEAWPAGAEIRVRAAVHTGEALIVGDNYKGSPVHRCARLRGLAHGGQVVVSEAAATRAEATLPPGTALRDLGTHELRGLRDPERVFQLDVDGLDGDFPPLLSAGRRHNVAHYTSPFIGREVEYDSITSLLARSRLVTLVGPGGTGKTRLAAEVASGLVNAWPDGVWFVELASLPTEGSVATAAAAVLKVRGEPERPMLESLADALWDRRALIVLDNCEHVIDDAAKVVDRLLRDCPKLAILATSRMPLAVSGEQVHRLAPLGLPPLDVAQPHELEAYDSIALFVERARSHRSSFTLDDSNAADVAAICRRLDGIPLAIELAAARVAVLSPADIARRLHDRFKLLTSRDRTSEPRQQTLHALIEWSYQLLRPRERTVLQQLSVFAGSFDLEAIEAVVSDPDIEDWALLDIVSSLVDHSLVEVVDAHASLRYRMLETIREYAARELRDAGGVPDARARHRAHYLAVAEACERSFREGRQGEAADRDEVEYDNLRRALATSLEDGDVGIAQRIGRALYLFWYMCRPAEGIEALAQLSRLDPRPTREHAAVVNALANMLIEYSSTEVGREDALRIVDEAHALAVTVDDDQLLCEAEFAYAWRARRENRTDEALERFAVARELALRAGDQHDVNGADLGIVVVLMSMREYERALEVGRALLDRLAGDYRWSRVAVLSNVASSELALGDLDAALAHATEAVAVGAGTLDRQDLVYAQTTLVDVLLLRGDVDGVDELIDDIFAFSSSAHLDVVTGFAILACALVASRRGELEVAARLHGAAEAIWTSGGSQIESEPVEFDLQQADHALLRAHLGSERFADLFESGATLEPGAAVRLARSTR